MKALRIQVVAFFVLVINVCVTNTAMQLGKQEKLASSKTQQYSGPYHLAWQNSAHEKAGETITLVRVSPGGHSIALCGINPGTGKYTININGSWQKALNLPAPKCGGPVYDCAWSPDSQCLAYLEQDRAGAMKIKGLTVKSKRTPQSFIGSNQFYNYALLGRDKEVSCFAYVRHARKNHLSGPPTELTCFNIRMGFPSLPSIPIELSKTAFLSPQQLVAYSERKRTIIVSNFDEALDGVLKVKATGALAGQYTAVDFSGEKIALGTKNGEVEVVGTISMNQNYSPLSTISVFSGKPVALLAATKALIAAASGKKIKVFNRSTQQEMASFEHPGSLQPSLLALSPESVLMNPRLLYAAGESLYVREVLQKDTEKEPTLVQHFTFPRPVVWAAWNRMGDKRTILAAQGGTLHCFAEEKKSC